MGSPIRGSTPIPRTRWTLLLLCLQLLGSGVFAGQGRSGYVVLVQDRLIYIDMGIDAGVEMGDLFQMTRRTGTGTEEAVCTGRAIVVDNRLSVLEAIEEETGVSVLDIVRRTVVLIHEPPSSILAGSPFSLYLSAGEGGRVVGGALLYRNAATGAWIRKPLLETGQAGLTVTIPAKDVRGPLIQYCFNVTTEHGDEVTHGTTDKPLTVPVDEGSEPTATVPGRPSRWQSLIPGLYQMRSGRPAEGASLALLELGCLGGGVAIWPRPGQNSYRPERRMAAKGVWGIAAVLSLYGVVDSFRDRDDPTSSDDASVSLMLVARQRDAMLRVVKTGL